MAKKAKLTAKEIANTATHNYLFIIFPLIFRRHCCFRVFVLCRVAVIDPFDLINLYNDQ